jgi:TonB family protein
MFGATERSEAVPSAAPQAPAGGILGLTDYTPPSPEESSEADLPAEARGAPVLFGQPLSPGKLSLRDKRIIVALAASVLFHFLLVAILPASHGDAVPLAELAQLKKNDKVPPLYLFPYLPKEKVEPPAHQKAPLSDLDRRAHGGVGQPDVRPGSHGNTPEPRLSPPAARQAGEAAAPALPPPAAHSQEAQSASESEKNGLGDRGANAILQVPKRQNISADALLKGLASVTVPGHGNGEAPDRPGGQVDLGPLSFDTQWYDWGPYAAEMLRRIRYHWMIPEIAMLGVPGTVRIHFFIERNGRVTGLQIQANSDHPPMDFAARDAILEASPLPPLPPDLTGVDREGVTITFYYNVKPPEGSYTG